MDRHLELAVRLVQLVARPTPPQIARRQSAALSQEVLCQGVSVRVENDYVLGLSRRF